MVSGCEHAFKAFERIQRTTKIITMITSRIIPSVWGALQSYGPQNPNQSESKSKKVPVEGVPFLS